MRYVFLVLALAPMVVLVVGRLRGRDTVKPCCAPPEQDGRIAAALAEDARRSGQAGTTADGPRSAPVPPEVVR